MLNVVSYIFSENDVISSIRKHYCPLRLGLGLELRLGLGAWG